MSTELIKIGEHNGQPAVSGRDLHAFLEVETPYHKWFPRMAEYGFSESIDFNSVKNVRVEKEGGRDVSREVIDHAISLDMAKELSMIQRTAKGKEARLYFIECEKRLKQAPQKLSFEQRIVSLLTEAQERINAQAKLIEVQKPKAEYFDQLVDRGCNSNFRDTAKELHIREGELIAYLLHDKYIYRDQKNHIRPYSMYCQSASNSKGYFTLKDYNARHNEHAGQQCLITPHGRSAFRLLYGHPMLDEPTAESGGPLALVDELGNEVEIQ